MRSRLETLTRIQASNISSLPLVTDEKIESLRVLGASAVNQISKEQTP